MSKFNNNYEEFIQKVVEAETSALNSEKGQKILQKLYDEVMRENPNLTPEEWSATKKQFLVVIFKEILKENPNFTSQFIGLIKEEIAKDKIPSVPEKRGYYGKWSSYDFASPTYDAEIEAEYYRNLEIIESELKRGDKAILLLCGAFDDTASIRAVKNTEKNSKMHAKKILDSFKVKIDGAYNKKYTVRYLPLSDKKKVKLYAEYDGKVVIGKLNVDENPETCEQFGIMNIPTILFFKNGELVNRSVGYTPKPRLQPLVEGLL